MIVYVVSTSNGVVGVFKDKEAAVKSVHITWENRHVELIEETKQEILISIREKAKVGELNGNYLTSVRINPMELLEAPDHL